MEEAGSHSDQPLVEPLTDRELEVLCHLAERRTNREIADQLVLSLNTVKWYARQIYGKLGVGNRREAVERARELGLAQSLALYREAGYEWGMGAAELGLGRAAREAHDMGRAREAVASSLARYRRM